MQSFHLISRLPMTFIILSGLVLNGAQVNPITIALPCHGEGPSGRPLLFHMTSWSEELCLTFVEPASLEK